MLLAGGMHVIPSHEDPDLRLVNFADNLQSAMVRVGWLRQTIAAKSRSRVRGISSRWLRAKASAHHFELLEAVYMWQLTT